MTPGSQLEAGQERSQQEGLGIHTEVTSQVLRAARPPRKKMATANAFKSQVQKFLRVTSFSYPRGLRKEK